MSASIAQFAFVFLDIDYDVSVLEYSAIEKISFLSGVNLTLVSEQVIPCEETVHQEGVLTIINPAGTCNPDRYFHGIIRMFRHTGAKGRFHLYEAQLVPSLWLLTLKQNCLIFQDMKLQDIIAKILYEGGITSDLYKFQLAHEDIFNKFNIQYNETDFDFISRLLEKEGIFYFFEHYKDRHVLVFCDTDAYYQDIKGDTSLPFNSGGMASANKTSISSFDYSDRLKPGVYMGEIKTMPIASATNAGKTNQVKGSLVMCKVNLESGEWISPSSCQTFYIDENAKFPGITYEIKTDLPGPYYWSWDIKWLVQACPQAEGKKRFNAKKAKTFSKTGKFQSSEKKWNADLGEIIGGILTVNVKAGTTTFVRKTLIRGKNPNKDKVLAEIDTYSDKNDAALLKKIFHQESRYRQFYSDEMPLTAFDNGYGMGCVFR